MAGSEAEREGAVRLVQSLDTKRGGPDDNEAQAGHLVAFDRYNGAVGDLSPTLPSSQEGGFNHVYAAGASGVTADDPLLPLGLDSHRYRCCGNGVVANVSEWLGARLALDGNRSMKPWGHRIS